MAAISRHTPGGPANAFAIPVQPGRKKVSRQRTIVTDGLWMLMAGLVGWIGITDVGVANQLALALCGMGALMAIRVAGLGTTCRTLFMLIAAFLTLRYLGWRVTQTLPSVDAAGFVPGILLFAAELYGIAMYFLGMFVNLQLYDRPAPPLPEALAAAGHTLPSVDVLVPSYNEGDELLERTLIAAQAMRYPGHLLKVFLLDDGGTEQKRADKDPAKANDARERHLRLQALCAELGAGYLTRARNEHAKAGNINAALGQTAGDLVLVLDADHIPTMDFLEQTIGYFLQDPKLFLVQTPHFFINPDPIERNLDTYERMPSENEMFYCVGQRGLDFWNASFFCGSAALLRRSCLDEVGGIAGETITEDAETALELHARGYHSAYVRRPMIAGLQPETFSGFIGQRTRWAQGMLQILILKRPLFKRGLSPSQRLCYLSSSGFWLFPIARLLFLLTPLAYLVFGLQIFEASFDEFLAYAVAHLVASLMLANLLFGHVRWPFISELYEIAQAPFIAPALLSVLLRPRSPSFKVTAKAETLEKRFVSHLARPLLILLSLLAVAAVAGAWRLWSFPLERESLSIVMVWNLVNIAFVAAALGVTYEQRQVRGDPRIRRDLAASLTLGDRIIPVVIADVSGSGARLLVGEESEVGLAASGDAVLRVVVEEGGPELAIPMHVRYASLEDERLVLGARFQPQAVADRRAIVMLCFGSSAVWQAFQEGRQGSRTVLSGLCYLVWLALSRGSAALAAALSDRQAGRLPAGTAKVGLQLGRQP